MTWLSQSIADVNFDHIPQYGGSIYYVSTSGSASNDGISPNSPLLTIGSAIGKLVAGDAISVMAGTYTEINLNLNVNNCEIWFEIGAILTPATGTGLIVSGNYCSTSCSKGSLVINPALNQTGVQVTGDFCDIADIRVSCGSSADLGIEVTAAATGTVIHNCRPSSPLVAAFKVSGDKTKIHNSNTGAVPADESIGYWITGSCDKTRLFDCSSQGHSTASIYVDSGCTNGSIVNFSSGGGDGRWMDIDNSFVWSNFTYADEVYKSIDVDTAQTINLFQITGTVEIYSLHGHVEEIITSAGVPTIHISVYSENGEADMTDDPGPNIAGDVVGTVYVKNADSTIALDKGDNDNTPFIVENSAYRDPDVPIIVGEDDAANTYIRFNSNAACTDGQIHWHCRWRPLSDTGFVKTV